MEYPPNFSVSSLLLSPAAILFTSLVGCLVLLFLLSSRRLSSNSNPPQPPQPPGSRPILGHLHLLGGPDQVMHRTLAKLADENGPIFMLKLGLLRAIVVSNNEVAKECISTHDLAFSDRPRTLAMKILGCNYAMIVASPYGPYWRELRKVASTELLSTRRLSLLKETRISELRASMRELYRQWEENKAPKVKVDLSKWFANLTLNSILQLIAGKSLRGFLDTNERDHCYKTIRRIMQLFGDVTVSDALPFLKWLDIGGHEKTLNMAAAEIDAIIQGWLEDHRRDRALGLVEKRDFMDVLIDHFESASGGKFFDYDVDTVIKATCQAFVLGGTDTTAWALTWVMSSLLNHPQVLKKAKDELNAHIGKERMVSDSDLEHLTYLHAIIKETMRLYPTGPVAPRESISDVVISGYYVPAGTRIFINIHKIHRDPLIYPNPDEFLPERFLGTTHPGHEDLTIKGQDYEFLPFGGGRRVCPGVSYALQVLPFVLANLLHTFDISRPSEELIDMTEGHGISTAKATPLLVSLSPKLPPSLIL